MDNALLAQIQKGRKLKKTETNDRSAPSVAGSKPAGGGGGGRPMNNIARPPVPGMAQPPSISHTASAPAPPSTGPQLGGLFTNGMPTLRKTRGAAVDTGRGFSTPSLQNTPPAPPSAPPSAPSVAKPLFHNQTLPRGFKMPPVPGRGLPTPSAAPPAPLAPAPPPPPPIVASGVPPKTQASLAPPAPPPPPPSVASGVSPRTQASLVPPIPGRSRSNSSPQRPVPPTPPRMVPSPPTSPVAPRTAMAVPPALPPGRPRASSASAPNTPPPIPKVATRGPLAPRSPLPPPPMGKPFARPSYNVPLTEGGKYTFRSLSDLPKPRQFTRSTHVYPSGENKGNAYPLSYDKTY